ncbi:hypothetical protein Ae201684P_012032 [Aphanomyces euteiches]|uniref:C5orf34-like C-terminal domain-containing protein n=1 Tax=Aphanomyces euteiches TaxID=100861 RepID=A0A6G0WJG0_9STRA|nr:hypothetical protein Ae201684_014641 [Aphanomyces euteiches]KAH9081058.1 hypothetical protein Ae201684P_012032 [Aphanomyces euteiches]KAH9135745.1 hypothetical protein AeRB84_018896 [Aphanomyces euteiches]
MEFHPSRLLLLRDGRTIGGFQLAGGTSKAQLRHTACLVVETNGSCFSYFTTQTMATSTAVQRFSCASCPSIHVPLLRQVLEFRNKHALSHGLYLHQHHLLPSKLQWRSGVRPSLHEPIVLRWQCGTYSVSRMDTEDGLRIKSLDGTASVTLSKTGHHFQALFLVPVESHVSETTARTDRYLVTRVEQVFFCENIPKAFEFPCQVLLAVQDARRNGQTLIDMSAVAPTSSYISTFLPLNHAFFARPKWTSFVNSKEALSEVDIFQLCRLPSKPATTLMVPLAVEWTPAATFHILQRRDSSVVVHAQVHADLSSISLVNGIYHHQRGDKDHCYTKMSVPPRPPFQDNQAYDLVDICLNMERLSENLLTTLSSSSTQMLNTQMAVPPNQVLEDHTTNIGRFRAFGDGRVRIVFSDRTILSIDRDARFCSLFLPSGTTETLSVMNPRPEHERYIMAALSFQQWAFRSPGERAEYMARLKRQQETVEVELRKTTTFMADIPVVSPGNIDSVQGILDATSAHIHQVQQTLLRHGKLENDSSNYDPPIKYR